MASPSASTSSDDYCLLDCPKTLSLPFRARPGTDQADPPGDDDVDSDDGLVYVSRPESVRSLDTPPPNSPDIIKHNEHATHDDSDTIMLDQSPACQSSWKQSSFLFNASYDYHPQPKLPVPGAGVLVPRLSLCSGATVSEQKPNPHSPQIPKSNSDAIGHISPTCDDHRNFDTQIMDRLIEHALRVRAETCFEAKTSKDKRLKEQMFNRLLDLPPDHPVLAEIFRHTRPNPSTIHAWQNYDDEVRRKNIFTSIFTDVEKVALWYLASTHAKHFAVACVFTDITFELHTGLPRVSQVSLSAGKQLAMEILSDCLKPIEICNLLALQGNNELRKWSWTQMIAKTGEMIGKDGNNKLPPFNAHVDLLHRGDSPLGTAEAWFEARAIRDVFMTTLQTLLVSEATANLSNALHGSPRHSLAMSANSSVTVPGESFTMARDAIKRGVSSTDFGYDGSPTSPPAKRPNLPLTIPLPRMQKSATPSTTCNPRTYSRQELCEKLPVSPELRHKYLKLLVQKMGCSAKTTSNSTNSSSIPISGGCQYDHQVGSVSVRCSSVKECCPLQICTWSNSTTSTENTLFHVKANHPEFSRYLIESVNKALRGTLGPAVPRSTHPLLSEHSARTTRDFETVHPEGIPNDRALVEGRENIGPVSRILDDCICQHGLSRMTTLGKEIPELPTIPYREWKSMLALEDYQVQLMLLEEQNRKRLRMCRNMGNTESDSRSSVAGSKGEANTHHPKLARPPPVKISTDARTKNPDYEMQLKLLEEQNRKRLLLRRKEEKSGSDLTRSDANKKDEVNHHHHHLNPTRQFSPPTNCYPPVQTQDYQKQLQLLEQQNRERLLMARSRQQLDNDTSKNMEKSKQQASTHGGRLFQQTVASEFGLDLVSFSDSGPHSDSDSSECGSPRFPGRQDKNTLTSAAIHQDEAERNPNAAQAMSSPEICKLHAVSKPVSNENYIPAFSKSMCPRTRDQLLNLREGTSQVNLYPSQALPLRFASTKTCEKNVAERNFPNTAGVLLPSVLPEQSSKTLAGKSLFQGDQKAVTQPSQCPEGLGSFHSTHPKVRSTRALSDRFSPGSSPRPMANTKMHPDMVRAPPDVNDDERLTSGDQAKFTENLDALKVVASMCPTDFPYVRYDTNGVLWMAFTMCSHGAQIEYTIRADVENVNVDILTPQFKVVHRLPTNKPGVCPLGQRCGEDNCLFSESHRLRQKRAWQLADLNPLLRNNSALLAEATARYFTFRCWYPNQKPSTPSRRESHGSANIPQLSYEAQLQLLEKQCRDRHSLARQEQYRV